MDIRRQLSGRQSSPSTMWVPGTKFRLSGFMTGAFKQLNHLIGPLVFEQLIQMLTLEDPVYFLRSV